MAGFWGFPQPEVVALTEVVGPAARFPATSVVGWRTLHVARCFGWFSPFSGSFQRPSLLIPVHTYTYPYTYTHTHTYPYPLIPCNVFPTTTSNLGSPYTQRFGRDALTGKPSTSCFVSATAPSTWESLAPQGPSLQGTGRAFAGAFVPHLIALILTCMQEMPGLAPLLLPLPPRLRGP